jgi:hypothetical protein
MDLPHCWIQRPQNRMRLAEYLLVKGIKETTLKHDNRTTRLHRKGDPKTWSLGRLEIMTDFAMQTTEGRNDSMKTTQYRFISCLNLAQGISVLQAIYGPFQTPCPVM